MGRRFLGVPVRVWCVSVPWGICGCVLSGVAYRIGGFAGQAIWSLIVVAVGAALGIILALAGWWAEGCGMGETVRAEDPPVGEAWAAYVAAALATDAAMRTGGDVREAAADEMVAGRALFRAIARAGVITLRVEAQNVAEVRAVEGVR